jgi:intracellular septation protein A
MPDPTVTPAAQRQTHPLARAGKELLSDLLSTLTFVGVYALTGSVYLSIGLGIALGVGQIARAKFRGATVDTMQWMSLFLVVVFGGATLLTADPVFIRLKPTMIYAAVGLVMLKRGWMNRYLPPVVLVHAADVTVTFGYIWSGLMFATSGANLLLALYGSRAAWAWFIAVFPLASKAVLVLVQYGALRVIVRRRIRASRPVTT